MLFISGEVLSSAFLVRRSETFTIGCLLYGTITGMEGDSEWQIGRKVGTCEREGAAFYFSFLFSFTPFIVDLYVVILKLS